MFAHHLDLYFLQLEFLVTNLQNFQFLNSIQLRLMNLLQMILLLLLKKLYIMTVNFSWAASMLTLSLRIYLLKRPLTICTNLLHNNEDVIESINKSEFKNLLSLATQESYFVFNDILYKGKDTVTMGSPLGPIMANVFLSFYEFKQLEQYPKEFNPVFYRRQKFFRGFPTSENEEEDYLMTLNHCSLTYL